MNTGIESNIYIDRVILCIYIILYIYMIIFIYIYIHIIIYTYICTHEIRDFPAIAMFDFRTTTWFLAPKVLTGGMHSTPRLWDVTWKI